MARRADDRSQLLDDVLACVRDALVVTDREGAVVAATRTAEYRLGAPGGLAGTALTRYVDVPANDRVERALKKEGLPPPLPVRPRGPDDDTDVFTPVWERGQTVIWRIEDEEAQREPLGPVATMIEALTDAVVAVDPLLVVTTANRAARRLFNAAVGERLTDTWHGFGLGAFVRRLFDAEALHGEAFVEDADGSSFSLTGLPSADKTMAIVVTVDSTARALRERLEREFVANAAHELQTPLTAISGLVDALTGETVLDEEVTARFNAHLRRETQRLVRLVDAMLLLARVSAAEPEHEPVELAPLLRQVGAAAMPAPGVELVVDAPADLVAHTHYGLLEAVLVNLVQNAARHTVEGRILLIARGTRRGITIEVRDTGPGMDAATRARVFDRFFKAGVRREGFGLGLAIATQAAAALQSHLELDSWPGVGSVARIVLPHEGRR